MYTRLNVTAPGVRRTTSFMAPKGQNLRDLPQMMDVKHALAIVNYILVAEGRLEKRGGREELFDVSQAVPGLMIEEWTDDVWVFSYSTTVAAYRLSTGVVTSIKTNFVTSGFDGAKYGDYFLVASPDDRVGRISQTLGYDGQSANFTVGEVITGDTSGATAIVLQDTDGGTSGTLTLGNVVGTFEDNETINGSSTGVAVVNGTLTFTYTAISNAPYAAGIKVIGPRAFAYKLRENATAVQYSEVDDGTNPPFETWSDATAASAGGKVFYRNAGSVNSLESIGEHQGGIYVVFADKGKWAFKINVIDSAGTLTKVDDIVYYELDSGGKASLHTNDGIYYVNKDGLWVLFAVGQENVKYSEQVKLKSVPLGNDYFENINLDHADIVKIDEMNTLLITVRNDSNANNFIITYNTQLEGFGSIKGWNIRRFLNKDGTLYGIGSNEVKVWELFVNNDDDGDDIETEFYQEVNVGALETLKELLGQYFQAEMSAGTVLRIAFDIYDRTGTFEENKLVLQWTRDGGISQAKGYGSSGWGGTGWGGSQPGNALAETFAGFGGKIKNFQRLRVKVTSNDTSPHTLNWFSLLTREKGLIRRRNLTNIT